MKKYKLIHNITRFVWRTGFPSRIWQMVKVVEAIRTRRYKTSLFFPSFHSYRLLSINPSVFPYSILFYHPSILLSIIYQFYLISINLSILPSFHPSSLPFFHPSILPSFHYSILLSCPSIYPSIILSFHPSILLFFY